MFAKSAWDLAGLLTAVAGPDTEDIVSIDAGPHVLNDYTVNLNSEWRDWRLGVADRRWFWSLYDDEEDDPEVRKMFDHGFHTVARMRELGAHVVNDVKMPSAHRSAEEAPASMGKIIRHEMKAGLRKFFSPLNNASVKSLEGLVRFNLEHPEHAFSKANPVQSYLERALAEKISEADYHADLTKAHLWGGHQGIDYVLETENLDMLIVPGWSEMSIYAAWASKYLLNLEDLGLAGLIKFQKPPLRLFLSVYMAVGSRTD